MDWRERPFADEQRIQADGFLSIVISLSRPQWLHHTVLALPTDAASKRAPPASHTERTVPQREHFSSQLSDSARIEADNRLGSKDLMSL